MTPDQLSRRDFVGKSTIMAGGLAASLSPSKVQQPDRRRILNYNENMEYRRLGKTGLMVSVVCHGGHWKRIAVMMNGPFKSNGCCSPDDDANINKPEFLKNRDEVLSQAIEVGINYVDACSP